MQTGEDICHVINVKVDCPFGKESIKHILEKGLSLGFSYADEDSWLTPTTMTPQDIDDLAEFFVTVAEHEFEDQEAEDFSYVVVKYQEALFQLWFCQGEDGNLDIAIDIGTDWYKAFMYYEPSYLDYARYVNVLVALCADVSILDLETDKY